MKPTNHNRLSDAVRAELEQLYLNEREMVLKAATRTFGNKQHAEDVLQNVFVQLCVMAAEKPERLDSFRKNPRAYLYQSAVNEAKDMMKAQRRQRLSDEDIEMIEMLVEGPDSDRAHDILRVRAAMATLDPEHAELLNLHYAEGQSCFEIGKLQGKLAATVTVQILRARNELKKALLKQEKNHGTQETKIDRSDSAGFTEAFEA
jgi:RNA polymerase sigma factor (sigma-70 family)